MCVFIDCRRPYSHATFGHLWTLSWVHFDGVGMEGIYRKYLERGGQPVFEPAGFAPFLEELHTLRKTAASGEHLKDMHINQHLAALLSLVMENSWRPSAQKHPAGGRSLADVKHYLDENFHKKITLDDLAERFYINYLARLFREQYGSSDQLSVISAYFKSQGTPALYGDDGGGGRRALRHAGRQLLLPCVSKDRGHVAQRIPKAVVITFYPACGLPPRF